jgi:hypothetical protein
MTEQEKRADEFSRNLPLEELLGTLNDILAIAERNVQTDKLPGNQPHPTIFIMGPLRCGSTLFTQWLSSTGLAACPTNLLSRFYGAPVVGALIQVLLTDPRYNFRNEILDFNSPESFNSNNGKTTGALSPNEFWYFWRNHLPFDDNDQIIKEKINKQTTDTFKNNLSQLSQIFNKPFALKSMIMNYQIPLLADMVKNSVFIGLKRNIEENALSALDARKRQLGDIEKWYSFRIPEYEQLSNLPPLEQTVGQVHFINRAVSEGINSIDESRTLLIEYESFCENPKHYFELVTELIDSDCKSYNGPSSFEITRKNPEETARARDIAETFASQSIDS